MENIDFKEQWLSRKFGTYEERHFQTADELWLALSPTSDLAEGPARFVYRGHGDADWSLIPSILRKSSESPIIPLDAFDDASEMVFLELAILQTFLAHCDTVGITIFGDSREFRDEVINTQRADAYYKMPALWPNKLALNLMAMAQHHGVPTRLLDWSVNPAVAMYFAASGAVSRYSTWNENSKLAVWALNAEQLPLHPAVTLYNAPGSVSSHLAAQGGLFSVHPHSGLRAGRFLVQGLENYFSDIPSPLIKLTIPVYEAVRLLLLCSKAGVNAARVYPTPDGAGKAVIDDIKIGLAADYWNKTAILVRR
ncbi:FRG domain-containing protein [Pseudomonas moorei]|uniref:FRG domain-containing protein n=1 Tax=Pseudomonas moorei TaxID=395599 RepID=UPI001FF683A5|nr:FRG domain-containing protein [Pseudomonas moorei]